MRVLHLCYSYYPEPAGGGENYVRLLIRCLNQIGIESVVAAPAAESSHYRYEGISVWRFGVSAKLDLLRVYGGGDPLAAHNFAEILEKVQPDIVHLHAFTSTITPLLVPLMKKRRIPTVFTYHTPTVTCQRGTLLQWGHDVCNGKMDGRCTACTLHHYGLSRTTAVLLASAPGRLGSVIDFFGLSGSVWTALRMGDLTYRYRETVCTFFAEVNHIIAVANWILDLLVINGVSEKKITLCRHGLAHSSTEQVGVKIKDKDREAVSRFVFLGRLNPTKGIDTIIRAVRSLPELPIVLDIYGVAQGVAEEAYGRNLLKEIKDDQRIHIHKPVPADEVISLLGNYDALLVPSRWLEAGPLVVLEAFAAGIPVIGSNLGGIAEWVEHGVNGLLVEPENVKAWQVAITEVLSKRNFALPMPQSLRSMADVGLTMAECYQQVYTQSAREN